MLTIELPAQLEERLEALAKREGQTTAILGHQAILDFVEELEAGYLALERLEKGGKTIPHEEVVRELGLDD